MQMTDECNRWWGALIWPTSCSHSACVSLRTRSTSASRCAVASAMSCSRNVSNDARICRTTSVQYSISILITSSLIAHASCAPASYSDVQLFEISNVRTFERSLTWSSALFSSETCASCSVRRRSTCCSCSPRTRFVSSACRAIVDLNARAHELMST